MFFLLDDFPVLQIALQAELGKDECKNALIQMAHISIPNNPIVYVRLCELLSKETSTISKLNPPHFLGLNGYVALTGLFFVEYNFLVSKYVSPISK